MYLVFVFIPFSSALLSLLARTSPAVRWTDTFKTHAPLSVENADVKIEKIVEWDGAAEMMKSPEHNIGMCLLSSSLTKSFISPEL